MRRAVPVLVALFAAGLVASTSGAGSVPDPFVFPVVGPYRYTNDFGDPRSQGRHEGNDVLAPKKSIVVAVEDGKVKFWTTSAQAGCMLYLYGASGTTYLYIHLNNDVTAANDNRGKCVPGTAYWPGLKDGQSVLAGQAIAYLGDSGDADGTPHLHFEVHPRDGPAVNPYPYLNNATRILFAAPPGSAVTLSLKGRVLLANTTTLRMKVDTATVFPVGITLLGLRKPMVLTMTRTALIGRASLRLGRPAIVLTQPAKTSLETQAAEDGVFSVARIVAASVP
jgi:hypothetical protein